MREEHPIDQHFRNALLSAEVQPPPSVWDGVKNGRRRRRGLLFWSRRRGLTIATLFVALGAGAYWAIRDTPDTPNMFSNAHVDRNAETPNLFPESREEPVVKPADTDPQPVSSTGLSAVAFTNMADGTREKVVLSAKARTVNGETTTPANPRTPFPPAGKDDVVPVLPGREEALPFTTLPEPSLSTPLLDAGIVSHLKPIPAHWNPSEPELTPVAKATAVYVLPASEWWVAAQVGWYDVRRQWSGTNATLEGALNASETWTSTIGVGALVGRTWRSGFGFSAGAEHERSEQAFRYVDRWTSVDQEITTNVVTLDTQVFVSQGDTITRTTLDERIAEGMDRRSVLRVPLDAHWRSSWRRWSYGLAVGMAAEITRTSSNMILVQDGPDGRIASAQPRSAELRERYPTVFLGTISADLGYLLHERWTLWASPVYMHSLGVIGSRSEVFAEPERLGLRLRLGYTFNCRHAH